MTSIVISGRPNSELTSQCILLSEELKKYFPSVTVIKVLKHPDEWNYYSEEICKLFGFQKETHPLIYFTDGDFIGDKDDFFKLVETMYKLKVEKDKDLCPNSIQINHQIIYNLTQENIKKVNDEYNTRMKGPVLREKVDILIRNLNFLEDYNTLNYDYSTYYELGTKFFYKYDRKFTPTSYEVFLDPKEIVTFEVDLKTNKIIENQKDNSLYGMSIINNSKEYINQNQSVMSGGLNNDRKKTTPQIEQPKKEIDEENEEGDEETSIKKMTFTYFVYKKFVTPKLGISNNYIIAENVFFLLSLDLIINFFLFLAIHFILK